MGLRIRTNVAAMAVMRNLHASGVSLNDHSRRLSSGLRIEAARDDAAGLGISERMRAEVRASAVAGRTAQDGISLLQVAEGALGEVGEITSRMRELAMQSLNGTLGDADRDTMQVQAASLADEAARVLDTVEFNGLRIFPQSPAGIELKAGTSAGDEDVITIDFEQVNRIGWTLQSLSVEGTSQSNRTLAVADLVQDFVGETRGTIGAMQLRLESAQRSLGVARTSLSASESRIRDADVALETAGLVRSRILQQGGVAVLAQANTAPQLALDLLRA